MLIYIIVFIISFITGLVFSFTKIKKSKNIIYPDNSKKIYKDDNNTYYYYVKKMIEKLN